MRVDVAQRAVVERMALAGIAEITWCASRRPAPRLVTGARDKGDCGDSVVDLDTGTVRRVTRPADMDVENSKDLAGWTLPSSPTGRFPISVRGYDTDTQGAPQSQMLWTVPNAGV